MRGTTQQSTSKTRSCVMTLVLLFVLCCIPSQVIGQDYGMQFRGHDFPLDQRSGLDLTSDGPLIVKKTLDLEFHLRFTPGHASYFGYIFRMLLGDQNIDLIHGIVPENPNNIELIIGDRTSKIALPVSVDSITRNWLHLKFQLDLENQSITFTGLGREISDKLEGVSGKSEFRLMFGAHSHGSFTSTDVPEMNIRDVRFSISGKEDYHWPLNEIQGNIAYSVPAGIAGKATNPEWLLKQHYTWNEVLKISSSSPLKTAYDPRHELIYMVSKDSIIMYDIADESAAVFPYGYPSGTSRACDLIFDTLSNQLLLYSVDNNRVAALDQHNREWIIMGPTNEPLTSYWHHNRHIAPDGSLYVFGGYGQFTYKNSVYKWNWDSARFENIEYTGKYDPRYLAGSGISPVDGSVYLIGGYGSESGEQSIRPDYYYELLSYSFEEKQFTKLQEFEPIDPGFCFANSVVVDDLNNIYGLCFTKYDFNNQLQLIQISAERPEITEVASPIEYNFLDVNSYADLFYSSSQQKLIALATYNSEEGSSLTLHSLAFPPQAYMEANDSIQPSVSQPTLYIFIGAGVLLIVAIFVIRHRKKQPKKQSEPGEISSEPFTKRKDNSILLFGGFQVFDNKGEDITGQFTPLLKKLLLYILLHTLRNEKGVSSNSLYETFWFDKSVESARNNRSVNIVKLKSLLENIESVSISKDTGYWKFGFDSNHLHIDYYEYLQLVRRSEELKRLDMERLLAMVENRPFLNNTHAEWLDPFKSEVSNEIIDTFLKYINQSSDDPEFLLHLTNCIFVFDTVSEEALKLQCRLLIKQGKHSLAKSSYDRYVSEYKHLYDEDFRLSFNQVIGE